MLKILSLATDEIRKLSADKRWREFLQTARDNGRKLYFGLGLGDDVGHAFRDLVQDVWQVHANRLKLADLGADIPEELRATLPTSLGWTISDSEPLYLDPLQARLGQYYSHQTTSAFAIGTLNRALTEIAAQRARHGAALTEASEKLKKGEIDRNAYDAAQRVYNDFSYNGERDLFERFAREATKPQMSGHRGYVVVDPTPDYGAVVDFLTSPGGGMVSVFDGYTYCMSGANPGSVGADGKDLLRFMEGTFILVKSNGTVYSHMRCRCGGPDDLEATFFASRGVAERYLARLGERASIVEVTDEVVENFGTTLHDGE